MISDCLRSGENYFSCIEWLSDCCLTPTPAVLSDCCLAPTPAVLIMSTDLQTINKIDNKGGARMGV